MRPPSTILAATLVAGSLQSASPRAQEIKPRPWFAEAPRPKLFGPPPLFAPTDPSNAAPAVMPPTVTTQPQIVCGMTVVQADSSIDRGILHTPNTNGVVFAMRAVEPTACRIPSAAKDR